MSLLLCIDSSANFCSVVLSNSKQIVATKKSEQPNAHAEVLTVFIADVLQEQKISIKDVDAIAYSSGPGSYTGLRIGSSVCKGLCYAHNIPFIAIPTLQAMSSAFIKQHYQKNAWYIPVIDARRSDIYFSIFTDLLQPIILEQFISLEADSFQKHAAKPLHFFGNAADKCKKILETSNCTFTTFQHQATDLIDLATDMFEAKQFNDIVYFEPNYLKTWQAKTKKNKKLQL
ncbi:MAG: tRNA (adenosine(37)-N6)-threonylcarbamoyltransferase complex dimerization subunit type 1 TsaB [Chitinophagales bacterium]